MQRRPFLGKDSYETGCLRLFFVSKESHGARVDPITYYCLERINVALPRPLL